MLKTKFLVPLVIISLGLIVTNFLIQPSRRLLLAQEQATRGISIVAADRSGQKKEVRLYQKTHAVIIGIDKYKNLPPDKQLSYAVRDAKGVAETLSKLYKFDSITTLYNEEATRNKILETFSKIAGISSADDAVFIFFAGHGYTKKTKRGELGYLVPHDGSFNKLHLNISMTTIKEDTSRNIPAKHIFYVVDACYSGLLLGRGAGKPARRDLDYLLEITKEEVRQVLTAGNKDQVVLDGGPKGHSVFTGRFIEALEEASDFITAREISQTVKEKVFSDARARGHTQTPKDGELFGLGDFVFVPNYEKRQKDSQATIKAIEQELKKIEALRRQAEAAQDNAARQEAIRRQREAEARLKAKELERRLLERQAAQEAERLRVAEEQRKKQTEEEGYLAMLKLKLEEERRKLPSLTTQFSLPAVLKELKALNQSIANIESSLNQEKQKAIARTVEYYEGLVKNIPPKDDFESRAEYQARVAKAKAEIAAKKNTALNEITDKYEETIQSQIIPLIKQRTELAQKKFTVPCKMELQRYNAEQHFFPVKITLNTPGVKRISGIGLLKLSGPEAKKLWHKKELLRTEAKIVLNEQGTIETTKFVVLDEIGKEFVLLEYQEYQESQKEEEQIRALIKDLDTDIFDKKWMAINKLASIGQRACPYLIELLGEEKKEQLRFNVIHCLEKMGKEAVLLLIEALRNPHHLVRQNAAIILGTIKDERAVAELKRVYSDPNELPEVKLYVANALQKITGQEAETLASTDDKIVKLIKNLGSDDWKVRENANKELIKIGKPALPALKEALKSKDPEIRMRANLIIKAIEK